MSIKDMSKAKQSKQNKASNESNTTVGSIVQLTSTTQNTSPYSIEVSAPDLNTTTVGQHSVGGYMPISALKGIDLYRALAKAGFPQGGQGAWFKDPNSDEKYYIPTAPELYTQFLLDPEQWQNLQDALARVWIENKHGTL